MSGSKAVLYDVEWQILRCEMLSENNRYGGWWSSTGVETNLMKCLTYIDGAHNMAVERDVRRWRVTNLLNATLLGYGNRVDVPEEWRERVRHVRNLVQLYNRLNVVKVNEQWNWSDVTEDIKKMSKEQRDMVLRNLLKRVKTSSRRNGEANKFTHRKDLEVFVGLLQYS